MKSFPIISTGFEIETELTIHALELELPVGESQRPTIRARSAPPRKLSTGATASAFLRTVLKLYRAERPLSFFGSVGLALAIVSIGLAIPIFITFVQEGLVPRLPTAVLSTGLMLSRVPLDRVRPDPRYRDARPARGQAHRVSGLRAPGEERRRS